MSEIRVGRVRDFPNGRGRRVRVGGEEVAVFRVGDAWYALQDACPHMGASLADGKIDGDSVVCHWHDWKFELSTGQGDQRSWACAAVYGVRIDEEGAVWVSPPAPKAADNEAAAMDEDPGWIRWDDSFLKKKPGRGEGD